MMSTLCLSCKHFTGQRQCEAYPKQIPIEIWTGQNDHSHPYPGDNGIRFEPIEQGENTLKIPVGGR